MVVVVGILVTALIAAVGFAGYCWADAQASRRWVEWVSDNNPTDAIIGAIKQTQTADQQAVGTVAETIATSVKAMLGLDQPTVIHAPYEMEPDEAQYRTPKPFAELDPYMNDDWDAVPDEMTADAVHP